MHIGSHYRQGGDRHRTSWSSGNGGRTVDAPAGPSVPTISPTSSRWVLPNLSGFPPPGATSPDSSANI